MCAVPGREQQLAREQALDGISYFSWRGAFPRVDSGRGMNWWGKIHFSRRLTQHRQVTLCTCH